MWLFCMQTVLLWVERPAALGREVVEGCRPRMGTVLLCVGGADMAGPNMQPSLDTIDGGDPGKYLVYLEEHTGLKRTDISAAFITLCQQEGRDYLCSVMRAVGSMRKRPFDAAGVKVTDDLAAGGAASQIKRLGGGETGTRRLNLLKMWRVIG